MTEAKINWRLIKQAATIQESRRHTGSSVVKTRGQVSGGGRKPWKQKGTGRARSGSIRGAQWRGGGIIFGPTKESRSLRLPRKMKAAALVEALAYLKSIGRLKLVENFVLGEAKTKLAKELLIKLELPPTNLLLVSATPLPELILAINNLPKVALKKAGTLSINDLLSGQTVAFDREAATFYNLNVGADRSSSLAPKSPKKVKNVD